MKDFLNIVGLREPIWKINLFLWSFAAFDFYIVIYLLLISRYMQYNKMREIPYGFFDMLEDIMRV